MSDTDPAALVDITSDIVSAYLAQNHVPPAQIPGLITTVHATLAGLGKAAPEPEAEAKPIPPASVRTSIGDDYLVSMEDGMRYTSLKRHLTKHGLTPADYRAKWGLPSDYPIVGPPTRASGRSWRNPWSWAPCVGNADPTVATARRASGRSAA